MTLAAFSSSNVSPTQRNRRLLLTLPAAVALPSLITACGGGADLSYDTEQALYFVGEAITPNTPKLDTRNPNTNGHRAPTYSVSPPLPEGLTLNAQTGVISGTPTKLKRQGTHLVKATNNKGSAETQIRIAVTGRGAWVSAPTIPGARAAASITPLPGGKFMVAGGYQPAGVSNSVEIFDSTLGTWSAAAPMQSPRLSHSAVVLHDGRVLVVGGDTRAADPGLTEIYDPVTNAWTLAGRLNRARMWCTAHLLASGKVLVTGGTDDRPPLFPVHDTTELYDPLTQSWSVLDARMSSPRVMHVSALLPDGNTLLIAGGNPGATAELYKVDGSATRAIAFGVEALMYQAVTLDDGSVLVLSNASNLSMRFHPTTSAWTTSPMVGGLRLAPIATVLSDGRVLVAGGAGLNTAEIYNPDVNRWTSAKPMAAVREGAMPALLSDGSVLVVSGNDPAVGVVDASERYIP